jgi:hypothetical protein|nr:MAG TPA: hypothetical protein [Caudoviricetes sp.]
MLWFEYGGPNIEGVTDRDTEMEFIRENMPPAMSYYHDDGFSVTIWDSKAGLIEAYVFDDGRPTAWYFSPKDAAVDAWWRKISTVGENTAVAARWIRKRIKRCEVKEESARLANDFILCVEEMRGSENGSPEWELALPDARDSLVDLCDLAGVPAEEVIGSDI